MIQKILKLIGSGNKSLNEISNETKLSLESLKERLEMLAHLGYLKRIDSCFIDEITDKLEQSDVSDLKKKPDQSQYQCKHCLISKDCQTPGKITKGLTGYVLTKKGSGYLGFTEDDEDKS
jgi:hypothetical protein